MTEVAEDDPQANAQKDATAYRRRQVAVNALGMLCCQSITFVRCMITHDVNRLKSTTDMCSSAQQHSKMTSLTSCLWAGTQLSN